MLPLDKISTHIFQVDIQQSIQNVQSGHPALVDLIGDDYILEVIGPSQKVVPYTTVGKRKAEFKTLEIGSYTLRFIDRETRSVVSTRNINVFNASMVKILEVGQAHCNQPATIVVSIGEAGVGTLSALVKCGALEVAHSIRQSKNSQWEVVYHPTRIAPHKVTLMFNGIPISTKPIEIIVMPTTVGKEICVHGLGLYQARVGKTTSFAIDTNGRPAREFDVVVSGPGGQALPVRCYQTKGGHLQAEFTVQKTGKCKIDVLHNAKPLPGSPYTCEAYDSTKVQVMSVPKAGLAINHPISFLINTQDAGEADVDVTVLSPTGQNVPVNVTAKGENQKLIEFIPTISGHYKCIIMYGGEQVKMPITFAVASTTMKSDARAIGNGLEVSHRGKETSFNVFCPAPPNVQIEHLDGKGERIEPKIKLLGNNEWRITYTILSVGRYEIRASCPNRGPLPGSPWHVSCVDSTKVVPITGWSTFLDNEGRLILPAKIIFDVSEAGPGELICTVDGNEINVEKQDDLFKVNIFADNLSAGEHDFDLSWSGMSIGQCPITAFVTSQQAADKVSLTGRGLSTAQIGEAAHFTIDATQVMPTGGKPEVVVTYQDGFTIPVTLNQPRPDEPIWLASYTPPKSSQGPLNLYVKWGGRVIKGCPFSITFGSSVDASKVKCSGEGLRHGVVGQQIKSWIDTRRAGPGELTAHCTGPRKVAYCELYDHGDATFTLNIKPQEPGRHLLTIKYGGQHVPGSPFGLRVVGAPDASKVRVYGPGIEHGVLATFQSRFICDTRGAGAGQLTVRVRGPKGAFRVEMQRESQKDRTILCKVRQFIFILNFFHSYNLCFF